MYKRGQCEKIREKFRSSSVQLTCNSRDIHICKDQSGEHLLHMESFFYELEYHKRALFIYTSTHTLSSRNIILLIWSLCGMCMCVMYLITASEVGSLDERIHTLADRRMVISLMNGAFDQDLNGLPC